MRHPAVTYGMPVRNPPIKEMFMSVIAITGSASGIGAALKELLARAGHTVIGIDRGQADIEADLSTPGGRETAVAAVLDRCVECSMAGLLRRRRRNRCKQWPGRCGQLLWRQCLLDGLAEALSRGQQPAAVIVGSIAATQPGPPSCRWLRRCWTAMRPVRSSWQSSRARRIWLMPVPSMR